MNLTLVSYIMSSLTLLFFLGNLFGQTKLSSWKISFEKLSDFPNTYLLDDSLFHQKQAAIFCRCSSRFLHIYIFFALLLDYFIDLVCSWTKYCHIDQVCYVKKHLQLTLPIFLKSTWPCWDLPIRKYSTNCWNRLGLKYSCTQCIPNSANECMQHTK